MHVIGTAGHVDHGKSTLVKALTGMDPDRFAEEKARGLTIDLGFAWCTLPSGRDIGMVDVPGHERFIRNMLAGVGGIDAALVVVAADEGWMPQSAEHLTILDFLEVRHGLVALSKADLVDDETLELAEAEIVERLQSTTLEGARIHRVSAVTGHGLGELLAGLDRLLDGASQARDRGRARLFVDRSFTITGAGTVVTGTLTGGTFRVGDQVEVLGTGQTARIRSIQTHRRAVEVAIPGSRVAANLVGLEKSEIRRGDAVVHPSDWQMSDSFAARLRVAGELNHPIGERGAYELYIGSAEVPCRLKFLEDPQQPRDGKALEPGQDLLVQVFCMRPLPLEPQDRFIVRDVGRWQTVAGGLVLDHAPGRIRRGDTAALARLRAREKSARESLVGQLVSERKAVAPSDLSWLSGLGPDGVKDAIAQLVERRAAMTTPSFVVDAAHERDLHDWTVGTLAEYHDEHRLEAGMRRQALQTALGIHDRLFAELLAIWAKAGSVFTERSVVRLPHHQLALSPEEEQAAQRAVELLRQGGASPPELADLAISTDLVNALQRRGDIVLVAPTIALAADVLSRIEQQVVRLISARGPVTVAQVRDAIETSRKYAVPLLEYLDSSGLTARQGDSRVLGPRGRKLTPSG